MKRAPKFKVIQALLYGGISLWSTFVLLPIAWMVFAAFKTRREIFTDPLGMPKSLTLNSFERAWGVGLGEFMLNSFIVTTGAIAIIVIVSGLAAYAIVRSKSVWMKLIYVLIVAGFAVPPTAVIVPLYQMMTAANFGDSLFGLIWVYAAYGIPFTTILFYAFFLDFPRELEEAARLDGCSPGAIFFRVVMPLSGPAIASAAIFQAVFIWNEFLLALLLLTDPSKKTLPIGILQLQGEFTSDWPALMAGLSVATLPIILLFLLLQRSFVRSLTGLGK